MQPDTSIWTDAFLQGMRAHCDPLADDTIKEIMKLHDRGAVDAIFANLRSNADLKRDTLPDFLKDYFDQASQLPAWADFDKLDKGAQFFGLNGLEITTLLMYKSLPSAYVCANGAAVLDATGRMEEFRGSTEKFQRRLMETAQFVVNVCAPDAFRPNGRGVENAMKVRLMHAAIRYFVLRDGTWDTAKLGMPINQEDLAGTLLSFSSLIQEGLDLMGIKNTPELTEGYFHVWQVAGHLMGLDHRLIPQHVQDGHILGHKILDHQMAASKAGKALTAAVVAFTIESIPGKMFNFLPEVFIRHYSGDQIADLLGVCRYGWIKRVLLPYFIDWVLGGLQKAEHISGITQKVSGKLTRLLLQYIIDRFYDFKHVEFYLPPSLTGNARLKTPLTHFKK